MEIALDAQHLGKKYWRTWALRDCTIQVPTGKVAALVGPNGAGKTTLLRLAVGLLQPTEGTIQISNHSPIKEPKEVLARIGFLAQDHPLYRGFSVADTFALGRHLNARWDQALAESRMRQLGIPLRKRVGHLSGGQQVQVALAMVLAKHPEVLLLDEPAVSLDPLARREFLRILMEGVAAAGLTVVLSSHIVADLERVCDYLIVLVASQVRVAGEIATLLTEHQRLVGPRDQVAALASQHAIISTDHAPNHTTLIMRPNGPINDPAWEVHPITLEDLVLAYLAPDLAPEAMRPTAASEVAG